MSKQTDTLDSLLALSDEELKKLFDAHEDTGFGELLRKAGYFKRPESSVEDKSVYCIDCGQTWSEYKYYAMHQCKEDI